MSLVGDIASLSESLPQTPGDEVAAVHQEMAVDAEQGLALVNELRGHVPAIDNLELGVGFEPSGELRWALQSFNRAGTDTTDPFYRSKALRAGAAILYSLGGQANANAAHHDTLLAFHAFDRQRDVPRSQFDQTTSWSTFGTRSGAPDPFARSRHSGRRAICSKPLRSSSKTQSQKT